MFTTRLARRLLVALMVLSVTVLSGSAFAAMGGRPLATNLTGANEVPGPGDPDGMGTAMVRINPGLGQLCYELTVSGIAPATAAHVHVGTADVAGPVVVGLSAPTAGSSSGCVSIDRQLALNIIRNPDQYYVNVHNAAYPAGAVRGQLAK